MGFEIFLEPDLDTARHTDFRIESDAPEIVEVFESTSSGCAWSAWVAGHLRFLRVGKATVRVLDEGRARASFDFQVVDALALSLDVTYVVPAESSSIERDDPPGRVTGSPGDFVEVSTTARDAEGVEIWTGDQVAYSIDDPLFASFVSDSGTARVAPPVRFLRPGTTALHARLRRLTATLELVIEAPPSKLDAGPYEDAGVPGR